MHIQIKFLLLLMFAVFLEKLPEAFRHTGSFIIILIAMLSYKQQFLKMLYRIRWLLIVLFLLMMFSTPGEYIKNWPVPLAPTYEGVKAAYLQAAKIITFLALLSILLGSSTREQLIGGFYQLLKPLSKLKIDAEKFAVRMWLTLYYVEAQNEPSAKVRTNLNFLDNLDQESNLQTERINEVSFEVEPLSIFAKACLGVMFIAILLGIFL